MIYKNELDFLELLSQIDEKYICEIQEGEQKRKVRIPRFSFALAAAITIMAVLSIGASAAIRYYISHKDNVNHEYHNNQALISELDKRATEPIVCENKHIRMTVDSVISDEIYIRCTATLEGIDNSGKSFISDNLILPEEVDKMTDSEISNYFENNDHDFDQFIPYMIAYSQSGERLTGFNSTSDNMFGKKGDETEATFTFGINKSNLGNDEKVKVECNQLKTYFQEQNAGIFEGMSFELPLKSNFDTLVLQSENGDEIYLSEVCLYENRKAEESEDFCFSVFYKDGDSKQNIQNAFIESDLYRLDDVEVVELNKIRYYPQRTLKASRSNQ